MRTARIVSGTLAAAACVASLAAQQQPAFRGGVDLMSVDVVALDKAGMPVSTLAAEDFTITFAKKPRRVVAAEFVSSARPSRAAAVRTAPAASSNRHQFAPRTLMFLVDTTQIPSGTGRLAMKGIGDYLDRLGPNDRVGVMTLSDTRVAPTVDRAPVRQAVEQLVGTSARLRDQEMTFGEASGIFDRDRNALLAYWSRIKDQPSAGDRTCAPPANYETTTTVSSVCTSQAEMVIERVRIESRRVIDRLIATADAMAVYPDQKAIVLVSGGLYNDDKLREDFANFAAVAEQTHVSLSAIFVEPEGSGGAGSSTGTRKYDSQVGFGGLVDLAGVSRGTAHRVPSDSTAALSRIDRELSGYYVVSFERDPVDASGTRLELDVRTRRPDVSILTRKALTPGRAVAPPAPEKAGADLKGGVAALLKSQIAVSQVPVFVDAFAMPTSADGSASRVILAVEIGRDPKAIAALGFQFADANGKVLSDGYEAPAKVEQLAPGRSGFVTAVPATSGRFYLRVGTIDSQGERGSLQHSFEIAPWPQGAIRLSDLMFGSADSGDFAPGVGPSADGSLAMRLIVRDNTSKFDDVKVKLVVARAADATPIDEVEIPLRQTPDNLRRFADASMKVSAYPPGEYVVSMVVTAHGTEVGQRQRLFVR